MLSKYIRKKKISVKDCLQTLIKCSKTSIIFYKNNYVYKQYDLYRLNWVREIFIVNYLNKASGPRNRIIKFVRCEVLKDYKVDYVSKKISNKLVPVVRLVMHKYDITLDKLKNFKDAEIKLIIGELLVAITYCIFKNVMHRDIKEKNIFININSKSSKNRIRKVVLADFNIAACYTKLAGLTQPEIQTLTHRAPEIHNSILNGANITYDNRVDVWSFCIVLSFMVTGKSFYTFLKDGYLQIDPMMICDPVKMIIAMKHFLKIFANYELKYLNLYERLIFMGIQEYRERCTFNDIYNVVHAHNVVNGNKCISHPVHRPSSLTYKKFIRGIQNIQNVQTIQTLHKNTGLNSDIITEFYKALMNTYRHTKLQNGDMRLIMFIVYVFTVLCYDNRNCLEFYIKKFNEVSSKENLGNIRRSDINKEILNVLKVCDFNIIYLV